MTHSSENEAAIAEVQQAMARVAQGAADQAARYGQMYPWRRSSPTYPPGYYRRPAIDLLRRLERVYEREHALGGQVPGEPGGSGDSGGPATDSPTG